MERINAMLTKLYVRAREQRGQAMPEYAVILAVIMVIALVAFKLTGTNVSATMNTVAGALTGA
ncbi:MAG TPA: hypothetical protein VNF49_14030 [Candidatus Binataceae bacterium]|nr:hypothetical protein [Candidatus Binataceae bacterium]